MKVLNFNNYEVVAEFMVDMAKEENKKVILGNISNLKIKMDWIKYFINQEKNKNGIIHLDTDNIYFEPF